MPRKGETDNLLRKLRTVLNTDIEGCDLLLCLAASVGDELPDIQLVQVHQRVATEFRHVVSGVFAKRAADLEQGELVLRDYDPQAKLESNEVEHLDLSSHEEIKARLAALADVGNLATFSEAPDFIENLRFYVIVLLPANEEPILCFRAYTAKKELKRSSLFGIVLRDGQYDQLEAAVFLFDRYVDCIVRGNELFILNKDKFHKIFQFYEMLMRTAEVTLATIRTRIPIDDFAAFEAACKGHLLKIAKLKNIASKPYFAIITMRDIKKAIKKYDLPIATTGKGENEKLCFDSSDKWAILRLLDDDYLESVMTGNNYEVNSKRLRE